MKKTERDERQSEKRTNGNVIPLPHLNGGLVAFKTDDFADKLVLADTDELVHRGTAHLLGRHDCAE